jgi:hypothetical protein
MVGADVYACRLDCGTHSRYSPELATIHGICPMLGVSDALKNETFMRKTGGTSICDKVAIPGSSCFRHPLTFPALHRRPVRSGAIFPLMRIWSGSLVLTERRRIFDVRR